MIGILFNLVFLVILYKIVVAIGLNPGRLSTDISNPLNFVLYQEPSRKYDPELVTHQIPKSYPAATGTIPARLVSKNSKNLIIFSHGNAEDLLSCTHFANSLAKETESDVVIYDPPGYGLNVATDAGERTASGFNTCLKDVLNHFRGKYNHVVLMGRSLGSGATSAVASTEKVDAVIYLSPFSSVKELVKDFSGEFIADQIDERWNVSEYTSKINENVPVFIIHGEDDHLIDPSHALRIRDSRKGVGLHMLPNKGHNDIMTSEIVKSVKAFNSGENIGTYVPKSKTSTLSRVYSIFS